MPDISLLHCLHKISSEADIEMDYVVLGHRGHRDVYEAEANRVISLLKSAQLYDAARAFAKAVHLPGDSVTIDQVLHAVRSGLLLNTNRKPYLSGNIFNHIA